MKMNETLWLLLLALSLGGATAWAMTGLFNVGGFVGLAALVAAARQSWRRLPSWTVPIIAPLFVLLGWLFHAKRWGWEPLWPALCLALELLVATWETIFPTTRIRWITPARLLTASYALLVVSVALGGMPVWCLLALLTAPVAWRAKDANNDARTQIVPLFILFITVGYLIKGLIR